MTALNKQALREAAEKATPGRIGDRIDGSGSIKYECHGYDGSLVLRTDHKNMEYGFIGDNGNADELFFRLCVPDVILALLDELEAAEKRIAEQREYYEGVIADGSSRIAELEARDEPKFVKCWSCKHGIEVLAIVDCDGYCPRCAAPIDLDDEPYAGIGVKGE